MNRDEMISAVLALKECRGSEREMIKLVKALDQATPGSRTTDLIFWPEKDLTPEQIVDTALARIGKWDDD